MSNYYKSVPDQPSTSLDDPSIAYKNGHDNEADQVRYEDRAEPRSCFLSPLTCGMSAKTVAIVHLALIALFATIASLALIYFAVSLVAAMPILSLILLVGGCPFYLLLAFSATAFIGGIRRRKPDLILPIIVLLGLITLSGCSLYGVVMILTLGADTNIHSVMTIYLVVYLAYISHVFRVLLRVRLDILQDNQRRPMETHF